MDFFQIMNELSFLKSDMAVERKHFNCFLNFYVIDISR